MREVVSSARAYCGREAHRGLSACTPPTCPGHVLMICWNAPVFPVEIIDDVILDVVPGRRLVPHIGRYASWLPGCPRHPWYTVNVRAVSSRRRLDFAGARR